MHWSKIFGFKSDIFDINLGVLTMITLHESSYGMGLDRNPCQCNKIHDLVLMIHCIACICLVKKLDPVTAFIRALSEVFLTIVSSIQCKPISKLPQNLTKCIKPTRG